MSYFSRSETDQILKMKKFPNCIYSAIFWLASTSPLALVLVFITIEKKSWEITSFLIICWSFVQNKDRNSQTVGRKSNKSFVGWFLSGPPPTSPCIPKIKIWKQRKFPQKTTSLTLRFPDLELTLFVVLLDQI